MVERGEGLMRIESRHSVEDTVRRIQDLLESKSVKVFAIVDHGGEAAKVGLQMKPTKVVLFGSPKAGTPLMQSAPSVALDLPLKALIAEDDSGKVWITWNDAAYLRARHGFPEELVKNIEPVAGILSKAAGPGNGGSEK